VVANASTGNKNALVKCSSFSHYAIQASSKLQIWSFEVGRTWGLYLENETLEDIKRRDFFFLVLVLGSLS